MATRLPALLGALLLVACGQPDASGRGPAGGKGDDPVPCPAGQTCVATASYQVQFTNPICATYEYASPVARAGSGGELVAKPKNVFCTRDDSEASGSRPESPQSRLEALIDGTQAGDELFLSFLSFSDDVAADALCEAAQRGVYVDFVLDSDSSKAQALRDCGADVLIRGHQGSVGYQHIKLVMVNPHGVPPAPASDDEAILALVNDLSVDFEELDVDAGLNATAAANIVAHRDGPDGTPGTDDDDLFDDLAELDGVSHVGPAALEDLLTYVRDNVGVGSNTVTMVFGSGNLSSGTHLHHENWHFAEVARDSYFAQNHVCLADALTDPSAESTNGKGNFRDALQACRAEITAPPEDDLQAFFIPALEDRNRIRSIMETQMAQAASVDIAAHRFSWREMLDAIALRFQGDLGFQARLVVDDDVYWLQPLVGAPAVVGFNSEHEAEEISALIVSGGGASGAFDDDSRFQVKFMETNHKGFLLHHNKFMIFRNDAGEATAIIYGAANFTGTGFEDNLENVYFTTRPDIVAAFDRQFRRFWGETPATVDDPEPPRATAAPDMPAQDVQPVVD